LLACGLHGHELLGTDAAHLRESDRVFAREAEGLRWFRCLRCDSWLPLPPPSEPNVEFPPDPQQVDVPLRGRSLRDRFVLRAIVIDRIFHIVVLAALAVAIFLFAEHRAGLHHLYVHVLNDLQGVLGGPLNDSRTGLIGKVNELFTLSASQLYLAGAAVTGYVVLLAIESVGLWSGRRWAEYLTLVETGLLVPFEIYELTSTVSVLKILTLLVNLAVVVYLLVAHRLFGIRGGGRAAEAQREADTGWAALERTAPGAAAPLLEQG
jgi:uncharacterized membrane protein (DUF2068 family)